MKTLFVVESLVVLQTTCALLALDSLEMIHKYTVYVCVCVHGCSVCARMHACNLMNMLVYTI